APDERQRDERTHDCAHPAPPWAASLGACEGTPRPRARSAEAGVASEGMTLSVESSPSSRLGLGLPALVAGSWSSFTGSQAADRRRSAGAARQRFFGALSA